MITIATIGIAISSLLLIVGIRMILRRERQNKAFAFLSQYIEK